MSGGGTRSLLVGAGVIQGLDGRDSDVSTTGLFQGLTYQAGLSGGAWLLSSFAGNGYPTISYLRDNLWEAAFMNSFADPEFLLAAGPYIEITEDLIAKTAAGYDTTIVDAWGRLLSYQLLQGANGGVSKTLSAISGSANFTSYDVPFPVILALGVKTFDGQCMPGPNATTYEFTPYEFGSWDNDVSAFVQTKYLGTSLKAGKPTGTLCTENFDNLGYVLGTSSNIYSEACEDVPQPVNSTTSLSKTLAAIVNYAHEVATQDLYALIPNPFYKYDSSTIKPNSANPVPDQKKLHLVDGGVAFQNNPIFPFLIPERNISAILVNDNSADLNNYPNGSEILTTYVQSFNQGLTRMPFIPPVQTFLDQGLNTRATFFGCDDDTKVTIVYLPNYTFSYASNTSTLQATYTANETSSIIANGVQIVSQGEKEGWGTCLACALVKKTGETLPTECTACFEEYCYKQ